MLQTHLSWVSFGGSALPNLKLVAVACGGGKTGFSRVAESIFTELHEKCVITHVAFNLTGDLPAYPWKVVGGTSNQVYALDEVIRQTELVKPDVVFIYHNTWFYPLFKKKLESLRDKIGFKIVVYLPIEGDKKQLSYRRDFNNVDAVVTFTEYGKDMLVESGFNENNIHGRILDIPHGIDTNIFKSLLPITDDVKSLQDNRIKARHALGLNNLTSPDSFIVFNGNKNQGSKRIDLTLKGFSKFSENKPKGVKLFLNMETQGENLNILDEGRRLGIEDRIITAREGSNVSDWVLNLIYNACDVGVNTSTGEGWGLVNFEHANTCSAQLVPRHSSLPEVWRNGATFLKNKRGIRDYGQSSEIREVDTEDLAVKLQSLYEDRALLFRRSTDAQRRVDASQFKWPSIGNQWFNLFSSLQV
jgi:D-inositol-3-phosphate glycosyltransferase